PRLNTNTAPGGCGAAAAPPRPPCPPPPPWPRPRPPLSCLLASSQSPETAIAPKRATFGAGGAAAVGAPAAAGGAGGGAGAGGIGTVAASIVDDSVQLLPCLVRTWMALPPPAPTNSVDPSSASSVPNPSPTADFGPTICAASSQFVPFFLYT